MKSAWIYNFVHFPYEGKLLEGEGIIGGKENISGGRVFFIHLSPDAS